MIGIHRRAVSALGAVALGGAALLAQAAPAAADNQQFLSDLDGRFAYLTPQQLLTAGYQACAIMDSGRPAADASEYIDHNLGVGPTAAGAIVSSASRNFNC